MTDRATANGVAGSPCPLCLLSSADATQGRDDVFCFPSRLSKLRWKDFPLHTGVKIDLMKSWKFFIFPKVQLLHRLFQISAHQTLRLSHFTFFLGVLLHFWACVSTLIVTSSDTPPKIRLLSNTQNTRLLELSYFPKQWGTLCLSSYSDNKHNLFIWSEQIQTECTFYDPFSHRWGQLRAAHQLKSNYPFNF